MYPLKLSADGPISRSPSPSTEAPSRSRNSAIVVSLFRDLYPNSVVTKVASGVPEAASWAFSMFQMLLPGTNAAPESPVPVEGIPVI